MYHSMDHGRTTHLQQVGERGLVEQQAPADHAIHTLCEVLAQQGAHPLPPGLRTYAEGHNSGTVAEASASGMVSTCTTAK